MNHRELSVAGAGVFILLVAMASSGVIHAGMQRGSFSDEENSASVHTGDVNPIPLPQMICTSDIVVMGAIADISEGVLDFSIEKVIAGSLSYGSIYINERKPNQFSDPRPVPYKIGQRFIFFLKKGSVENETVIWEIFGLLGEGELPVEEGYAYFPNLYIEGLEKKYNSVQGTVQYLCRDKTADLINAISGYYECFRWEKKSVDGREKMQAKALCNSAWVSEFEAQSWIHKYLIRNTPL